MKTDYILVYLLIGLVCAFFQARYLIKTNHQYLQWTQRKFGLAGKFILLAANFCLTTILWFPIPFGVLLYLGYLICKKLKEEYKDQQRLRQEGDIR